MISVCLRILFVTLQNVNSGIASFDHFKSRVGWCDATDVNTPEAPWKTPLEMSSATMPRILIGSATSALDPRRGPKTSVTTDYTAPGN